MFLAPCGIPDTSGFIYSLQYSKFDTWSFQLTCSFLRFVLKPLSVCWLTYLFLWEETCSVSRPQVVRGDQTWTFFSCLSLFYVTVLFLSFWYTIICVLLAQVYCIFCGNLSWFLWSPYVTGQARWKYRMQKWCKKTPSEHHRTTLSGYIFATKARIDNRKKTC